MKKAIWIAFAILLAGPLHGQEPTCSASIPLAFTSTTLTLLQWLKPGDLVLKLNKQPLKLGSLQYDTGPRRILLVVDSSGALPAQVREIDSELLMRMATSGRPDDALALISTRGLPREVKFGAARNELTQAIKDLDGSVKEKKQAPGILDAIMEGLDWFGAPQKGDAILIVAGHLESDLQGGANFGDGIAFDTGFEPSSKTGLRAVEKALLEHHVRAFGLQVGPEMFDLTGSRAAPTDENMFGLTISTGGFTVQKSLFSARKQSALSDADRKYVQQAFWQIYGSIAQYYSVGVQAPSSSRPLPLNMELVPDLRKGKAPPQLFYPHELACDGAKSGT